MSKITRAKPHITNEVIQQKIRSTIGFWRVQKWLIIHNALNHPRHSQEIADHLAVSKSLVHKTISEYNRFGVASIETKGKGGRYHSNLTSKEEQSFMEDFISQAQKGQIATAGQIKEAYEKLIGKSVHKTTIYRLLERTGWRKIVPLPSHPLKDKQAQDDFKKTSIKK
jgi:transposase